MDVLAGKWQRPGTNAQGFKRKSDIFNRVKILEHPPMCLFDIKATVNMFFRNLINLALFCITYRVHCYGWNGGHAISLSV